MLLALILYYHTIIIKNINTLNFKVSTSIFAKFYLKVIKKKQTVKIENVKLYYFLISNANGLTLKNKKTQLIK